jgi:molecular chaperone DnaK
MGKVIGIDLGTTNSCVAYMEGSEAVVIHNSEGSRTTPSIVAITEDDERLVGHIAKRQAITNPENTIVSVKRLIGRVFNSEEVQRFRGQAAFRIVEAPNGSVKIAVRGKEYSPPEISAMILQKMRQVAEEHLGERVTEAVITVPAYFDDSQRTATKAAGRIAGLEVLRVLNEPTAAAMAYGLEREKAERIAVYDLGGGTFDISILELGDGIFEVLSTNGDTFLGGDDLDLEIINWLADEFLQREGIDLREERMALQRLKEAAEQAKCELSSTESTEINLPFITADESGPKHLQVTLTREKLKQMVGHIIDRTLPFCQNALDDAGLTVKDIDAVVLVGGQTRMPLVQAKVTEFFGKEPVKGINPDEVVAVGAAIQAGILKGEVKDILLLDVTPLSLGVETLGGIFQRIIERNTTIPVKRSRTFTTAEDNQTVVAIHVLQGERELAAHNKSLGRFELVGIPPAPRGVPQIEVTFSIDSNGILEVTGMDLATKQKQAIRITATSGLTDVEIEEMIRDAKAHEEEDRMRREVVKARNDAQLLIYTTQRSLDKLGNRLHPNDRQQVEATIEKVQQVCESRNPEDIVAAVRELREVSIHLSRLVLQPQEAAPAPPEAEPQAVSAPATDYDEEFLGEESVDAGGMIIDDLDE